MKWFAWTTACLIGIGAFLHAPVHSAATDDLNRTSLLEAKQQQQPEAQPARSDQETAAEAPTASSSPLRDAGGASDAASFNNTVNDWQTALSQQNGFESWRGATWNRYPLGPGTHGWVVILSNNGQEVGYMVVSAAENGSLQLTEYGSGDKPLFSLNTLYRTLMQQELIPPTISFSQFDQSDDIVKERLYADSLASVWKVRTDGETYYIDAKSGELLPLKQDPVSADAAVGSVSLQAATQLAGAVHEQLLPSFDPYEDMGWVIGQPLPIAELGDLQSELEVQNKLTYVAELFDNQVTLPLPVIGYRQWDSNEAYLILDHDGPRCVLLHSAVKHGGIYS